MKNTITKTILMSALWISGAFTVVSSQTSNSPELLPKTLDNYANIQLPAHFLTPEIQALDNTPANNPTTNEGSTLGRVLFYDKKLSADNTISCGSCHQQEHGFSDTRAGGVGINGQVTATKSLPLANLKYRSQFGTGIIFGPGRRSTLEDQSLLAFTDSREMGNTSLFQVILKVESLPYYSDLFQAAFGDDAVTETRISQALSQFMRSMLSFSSKYDRGVAQGFANFTEEENLGRVLFNSDQTKCSECHSTDLQLLTRDSNGTHPVSLGFSTASLRNAGVREGFGRGGDEFPTLESALVHYNRKLPGCNTAEDPRDVLCRAIREQPGNPLLEENGNILEMNLSLAEENAIISFIETLSDPVAPLTIGDDGNPTLNSHSLLFEAKYSDPFFQRTVSSTNDFVDVTPSILLLLDE